MSSAKAFHDFVMHDVFSGVRALRSRPMFGGWGIYQDEIFFALIAADELYFKVDNENQKYFEELASEPFVYDMKGKEMTMSYWKLPEEIMENKHELGAWVERSVSAAVRAKKAKNAFHENSR